jgi:hypothetical protein
MDGDEIPDGVTPPTLDVAKSALATAAPLVHSRGPDLLLRSRRPPPLLRHGGVYEWPLNERGPSFLLPGRREARNATDATWPHDHFPWRSENCLSRRHFFVEINFDESK